MTSSTTIEDLKEMLVILNKNIQQVNEKVDIISKKLDEEIYNECKKMGSHIDFIEQVYDSMKYPLNYLCNTINNISNNNQICDEISK
jgi:pyridoxal biosynthesis lyase PdxS